MTPAETGIIVCHCRKNTPEDAEYIGRAVPRAGLKASKWANNNPLPPKAKTAESRRFVLARYRDDVETNPVLMAALRRGELLGKTVACWCYDDPTGPEPPAVPYCHGDVLRLMQAEFYDPEAVGDTELESLTLT